MAKDLFYETLPHLTGHFPRFGRMDTSFKLPRKIKRIINLVDSTTIQLFANCMDWAKHRRRKATSRAPPVEIPVPPQQLAGSTLDYDFFNSLAS
jgi:hypothetical protein